MIEPIAPNSMPRAVQWLRRGVLVELLGAVLIALSSSSVATQSLRLFGARLTWSAAAAARGFSVATLSLGLAAMAMGYVISLRSVAKIERVRPPSLGAILLIGQLFVAPLLFAAPLDPRNDPAAPAGASFGIQVELVRIARLLAQLLGPRASDAVQALLPLLVGLLSLLLGAAVIWAALGRLAPERRAFGAWLFAANPICLLAVVFGRHYELTMIALLLFAVYLQLHGLTIWVPFYLALAAYAHWLALLLLPAYLAWAYAVHGVRWRVTGDLVTGLLITVAIGLVLHGWRLPPRPDLHELASSVVAAEPHASLTAWLAGRIEENSPADAADEDAFLSPVERQLQWGLALIFAAYALVLLAHNGELRDMLRAWGWTLFAWICLAQAVFVPWTVVAVVGMAALLPGTRLVRPALLLSLTALIAVGEALLHPFIGAGPAYLPLLIFLPPLGYALLGYLRGRRGAKAPRVQLGAAVGRK